jgi:F0F1-type ATP synthase assembly protein I
MSEAAVWIGRVFGLVGVMLVPLWLGNWLDRSWGTTPAGVLFGIFLGLALSITSLVTWSRTWGRVPQGRRWRAVDAEEAPEEPPPE